CISRELAQRLVYTPSALSCFFFLNYTATPEIYTLSLHDALPILSICGCPAVFQPETAILSRAASRSSTSSAKFTEPTSKISTPRSEEHTSELQSLTNLVCRLLLEEKKEDNRLHLFLNTTRPLPRG